MEYSLEDLVKIKKGQVCGSCEEVFDVPQGKPAMCDECYESESKLWMTESGRHLMENAAPYTMDGKEIQRRVRDYMCGLLLLSPFVIKFGEDVVKHD